MERVRLEKVGGVTSVNGETGDVVLNLGDLNDVNLGVAGPSIGDIIAWDGNNWVSSAAPPADISGSSLGDLNDVDVTGVNDGDILVWNESAGEWQSTNRGTVPENTSDLNNDGENGTDPFITEADVNNILAGNKPDGTPDPNADKYLKEGDDVSLLNNDAGYITDAGVTKIIAGDSIEVTPVEGTGEVTIDVAIDASGVVINLDDLNDVNVPAPDDGDVLSYNGSNWVSSAAPPADISGSSINQLNDVDASGANDGDMLIWDGANWVNTPAPTKTSDLINDGENGVDPFITEGGVTNILNGLNPDGTPDAGNPGYLKPGDNVSELNNDANYITDTDTAADSNKLCGEDCSYYLDYQNFINTPEIPDPGDLELTAELGFSAENNADVEWGTTIRAIPTVIGGVQPVRLTYQWWNDFGAIISDTAIPGATNATYEIPETKVGYSIWCRVKATDAEGTEVEAETNKCSVTDKVVSAELWTEDSGKLYPTTLTNNVGIGTDSPSELLHLRSDSSALRIDSNRVDTDFYNAGIVFGTPRNNTPDGSTNIGRGALVNLGNGSPDNVHGTTWLLAASAGLNITSTDDEYKNKQCGLRLQSTGSLEHWAQNNPRLVVTSAGNVGIGTDSPASKLTVQNSEKQQIEVRSDGNANSDSSIILKAKNSNNSLSSSAEIICTSANRTNNNSDLRIAVRKSGDDIDAPNTVMTLQGAGKVGIGTEAPAEKLHVDGKVRANDYDLEALPPLSTAP